MFKIRLKMWNAKIIFLFLPSKTNNLIFYDMDVERTHTQIFYAEIRNY